MESTQKQLLKYRDIVGCIVLCVMIFVPFLLGLVQKDKDTSTTEKRALATFPASPKSLRDIQTYPRLFETYYADHFGFRDGLIKKYKTVKYKIGDSPSADLTIGKDDWLFLGNIKETYTKFHDPFGDVRNVNLYTEEELNKFAKNITVFEAWLAERDIPYVLVIPPNKHTVYFDKLPSSIKRESPQSALDQLLEYLKEYTSITVIDLRMALADERTKNPVFHKTDTHWNHYGADRAQYEILTVVNEIIEGGAQPERHKMTLGEPYIGDLAGMLGVDIKGDPKPQPVFDDKCAPRNIISDLPNTTIWKCDTKDLKALIYHDSFFGVLKPYFIRHFSQSTYISTAATANSVKSQLKNEKPDIFIEEWVERKLPRSYGTGYELNTNRTHTSSTALSSPKLIPIMALMRELSKEIKLRNMERLDDGSEGIIELKSTGQDPIIYFPELDLEAGRDYVLRVKFQSDVNSAARLYYASSDVTKFPFSDANSVRQGVKIGANDLVFKFSSPELGRRLRLDILAGQGTVKILDVELSNE